MSNRLMQLLNTQIIDVNARKNFVTISTAIAVAYALQIPNEISEPNPYAYFDTSLEEVAKKLIMEINETTILSVRDCLEMTRKLWTQRYNLIFNAGAINPALLIAMVGEKDPHSVGNEFLKFSETYRISSPQVLNELTAFIQDIGEKCGLGKNSVVNYTEEDFSNKEENTYSEEGFLGGVTGFLVGGVGTANPLGLVIGSTADVRAQKLREDIKEISERIVKARNGNIDEEVNKGTKLPSSVKKLDVGSVIGSALLGVFTGPIYGAYKGSQLQNLNEELQDKLEELDKVLKQANIEVQ